MKKPPVIHPFLFAIFPFLAFFAFGSRAIPITISEIAFPIGLAIAGSVIIYLFLNAIIKDAHKAGLLDSMVLIWFLSFGHVLGRLKPWRIGVSNQLFFIGSIILLTIIFIFIIKSKGAFFPVTDLLNYISIFLIIFNLAAASRILFQTSHVSNNHQRENVSQPTHRPNIYFILLDAYARADVLSDVYGFDNSDFVKHLEQSGFYVASQSPANYCHTELALAAMLNLTYLDKTAVRMGAKSTNFRPLIQMIQESEVRNILKSLGYSFVAFSSGYSATEIRNADLYISRRGASLDYWYRLIESTPLPIFLGGWFDNYQFDEERKFILDTFQKLSSFSYEKSPYFIFVHLLTPHKPFIFGKNGEALNPRGNSLTTDGDNPDQTARNNYIKGYRDQLSFINIKIEQTVDSILAKSKEPPVIILLGDHGPRAYLDWKNADATYLRESLAVLNAIYLPGKDYHDFYQGISSINTFIALINYVAGSHRPFLEDKSFYSSDNHPYDFVPFNPHNYSKTLSSFKEVKNHER
jgi:hypothetical protein